MRNAMTLVTFTRGSRVKGSVIVQKRSQSSRFLSKNAQNALHEHSLGRDLIRAPVARPAAWRYPADTTAGVGPDLLQLDARCIKRVSDAHIYGHSA